MPFSRRQRAECVGSPAALEKSARVKRAGPERAAAAGRKRLTSHVSAEHTPLACDETSSSPSQRAASHSPQQPEASPQHCLRRGPAPVDEAPPAEDRA